MTYPDGTGPVARRSYSQGWLTGVSWTEGATTTPILAAVSYSGPAGAFGAITSANVGQNAGAALYRYFGQLDRAGRLVADELVKINTGAMLDDEQIHYDPVGNVSAVTTVLPAGTNNQLFCYDEQNRLTWAAAGTNPGNPCGNTASASTFGGAGYYQTFSYDTLNRLTSGPLGSYTYGDTNHLHAATSVSSGYTASYDAAGDMQCRAPSSSTTCSGTKTGQALTWDVEGRLATWQNTTTTPTVTAKYLYDGEGNRVVQQVTDSTTGTTTTTSYIGSLETHTMTAVSGGPTSIASTDYIPAGKLLAVASNGTLSYLATSYQGSVVAALDSTGAVGVTASQLYVPYGGIRSQSGTFPTDEGYTGQRRDASTGLDYYGARYYDPTVGQFTSADTVLAGGLNRYGYVGGNPTTATDPSGHKMCAASCDGSEVSNLSPLQWDETYYNLAMTQQGAALTMALWSPDAWKQAQYYAYYYAHSNDLDLIVGQQAIAYREGRPSNDWNASPDLMKEYGELTGLTVAYSAAAAGGSVQDLVGDIRTTAYPSLLSPRVSETPSGPPLSQALDGDGAKGAGGLCSFAAETPVATPDGGEQAIGSLKVGDQVEAYDSKTGKSSVQTVEHVWINHDHDLIDLTLQSDPGSVSQAHHDGASLKQRDAAGAHATNEMVHTTTEHPWLTTDRGWVPASALHAGEQVIRLDGGIATVVGVRIVPGTAAMYNLTVGHLHTFAVGDGRYVVHNDCGPETDAIGIGPYASKSIPARGPKRNFTAAERRDVDDIGYATGCHTCGSTNPGTKSGHFVLDHQPPNQFNPTGAPQRLYPQCLACSSRQGGQIARLLSILQDFFP